MRCLVASAVLAFVACLPVAASGACDPGSDAPACCCAAATVCCETACDMETNRAPATPARIVASNPALALPVAALRVDPSGGPAATAIAVALKSVAASVARQNPPALYLRKSSYLI
jgi:hypothetical protein